MAYISSHFTRQSVFFDFKRHCVSCFHLKNLKSITIYFLEIYRQYYIPSNFQQCRMDITCSSGYSCENNSKTRCCMEANHSPEIERKTEEYDRRIDSSFRYSFFFNFQIQDMPVSTSNGILLPENFHSQENSEAV